MTTPTSSVRSRILTGAFALSLALATPAAAQLPNIFVAGGFPGITESTRFIRDSLVARARSQIGKPYRFGGRSPERGFDCSGFVQFVLAAFELDLPRTAAQQASAGRAVARDTSRLRPGDLLTFGEGKRISHIGIYIGNGRYIHASSKAGRVVESPIDRRAARVKPWRGARRILALNDMVAEAPSVSTTGQ